MGNEEIIDVNQWVELCYRIAGCDLEKVYVTSHDNQRDYFSFYDYNYTLDISEMKKLLPIQKDIKAGLKEAYDWYMAHSGSINKRDYMGFIDTHLT